MISTMKVGNLHLIRRTSIAPMVRVLLVPRPAVVVRLAATTGVVAGPVGVVGVLVVVAADVLKIVNREAGCVVYAARFSISVESSWKRTCSIHPV